MVSSYLFAAALSIRGRGTDFRVQPLNTGESFEGRWPGEAAPSVKASGFAASLHEGGVVGFCFPYKAPSGRELSPKVTEGENDTKNSVSLPPGSLRSPTSLVRGRQLPPSKPAALPPPSRREVFGFCAIESTKCGQRLRLAAAPVPRPSSPRRGDMRARSPHAVSRGFKRGKYGIPLLRFFWFLFCPHRKGTVPSSLVYRKFLPGGSAHTSAVSCFVPLATGRWAVVY